jgi:Protein of unknown function (DUF2510)
MPRNHRMYGGAHAVAVIFKIASIVVILVGVISLADLGSDQTYIGSKGALYAGIIGGTIFTAAAVAFFAYVLDLLLGIERNTFAAPDTSGAIPSVPRPTMPAPSPPAFSPQAPAFPQPGWYADPQRLARVRYWDGRVWTEQTQA